MTTTRIQRFTQPFSLHDGSEVFNPFYHIVVTTDEGTTFLHFYRFEGWQTYVDSDGATVVVRRISEALKRASDLKDRIDHAIEREGIYGLDSQYWQII